MYKFTTMESAVTLLENRTLKFSKRSEFNDVYECRGHVKTNYSEKDWERHFFKLGMSADTARFMAKGLVHRPQQGGSTLMKAINDTADSLGILCLTTEYKNNLMWAHYADCHKGVCLRFDVGKDMRTFCIPKKVIYNGEYPEIDFLNAPKSATDVIFHKSKEWEYENEYRVIEIGAYDKTKEACLKPFRPEALTGIYFGCKCSGEDIDKIKRLVESKGYPNVEFYRMEPDNNGYELTDCPI